MKTRQNTSRRSRLPPQIHTQPATVISWYMGYREQSGGLVAVMVDERTGQHVMACDIDELREHIEGCIATYKAMLRVSRQ